MSIHIIRPGETIDSIAMFYRLSIDEIKSINPHFRSWEHLAPGAKLRIPEIPEYIKDEIDEIEPFIEEYYPTINIDEIKEKKQNNITINEEKEEEINNTESKSKPQGNFKQNKYYQPYYNPYYYNPYYNYYNVYQYKRKR